MFLSTLSPNSLATQHFHQNVNLFSFKNLSSMSVAHFTCLPLSIPHFALLLNQSSISSTRLVIELAVETNLQFNSTLDFCASSSILDFTSSFSWSGTSFSLISWMLEIISSITTFVFLTLSFHSMYSFFRQETLSFFSSQSHNNFYAS